MVYIRIQVYLIAQLHSYALGPRTIAVYGEQCSGMFTSAVGCIDTCKERNQVFVHVKMEGSSWSSMPFDRNGILCNILCDFKQCDNSTASQLANATSPQRDVPVNP